MTRFLGIFGNFTVRKWKAVLITTGVLVLVSFYGISHIRINDNPIKWFSKKHQIRIADKVLNQHFGGTYSVYLILEAKDKNAGIFQEPAMLRYIESLQEYLYKQGDVGKSTSLADITKKVYYELLGGDKKDSVIPGTKQAIAQSLLSFESSHKPDDLWHFTSPDYSKVNVWLQLKSGDNRDMARVAKQTEEFFKSHPAPYGISHNWAGLTYLNMVWQDKMVGGMMVNFLGSFLIVLFMMIVLFKSPVTGLISMIPLSVTILFIYSTLGFLGRDYDMPVAVLSALTLGMAVDFAIHFIERSREIYKTTNNWIDTAKEMFKAPGRALIKNALVVSIGFLPLFVSPLVPYNTVGFFMFMIMLVASIGTLLILPAIITGFPSLVFPKAELPLTCSCGKCILMALIASAAVVYILLGYSLVKLNIATVIAIIVITALSGACVLASRHKKCKDGGHEHE